MTRPAWHGLMALLEIRQAQLWRWGGTVGAIALVGCATSPEPSAPEPESTSLPPAVAEGPPPPPPGAFLAQLPPEVSADLKTLNIPIVAPNYLPPGFDLAEYKIEPPKTDADGPGYGLVYRDGQDRCFAIEAISGGAGGPVLDQRLPIDSPLFGTSYVLYYESPTAATKGLVSDWLSGDKGLYRYAGAQLIQQAYDQSACTDLPPEEAVKIIESLTLLSGDSYGDDLSTPPP